jgi:HK97 family phage major capsid protein
MTDDSQLAEKIGEIATAFDGFKRKQAETLDALRQDVAEQRNTVDKLETKLSRPGALVPDAAEIEERIESGDLQVMRTRAEFQKHYRPSGTLPSEQVSLADFMRGVANIRTTESVKASLAVGTDSAGGYAVPDVVMPDILSALTPESSLLQAGAGFVSLNQGAKTATTVITDTLPTAAWRSELGTVAEADPTFRGVEAVPRSIACVIRVSRELLADAVGMDSALRLAIGQAFAKELDRTGLRGTGTAPEPRGLKNIVGINAVTNGTNGASPTDYSNFVSAWQGIVTNNAPAPTSAIMHPRDMATFEGGLADTTGQPLRRPPLLESMKFLQTSQIPTNLTVGTSTDCSEIYVGDFRRMYFLIRENLSIQLLREHYATTGEIGFLCHARVDVVVPYPKAFALITGVRA